jgi:aldehyde:ferredoxin oxidoreductase
MQGFYNQILTIDLTNKTSEIQSIEDRIYETYLGGKGLASWLLFEHNPRRVDPLSPDNLLIFATGAVTGGVTWGGVPVR